MAEISPKSGAVGVIGGTGFAGGEACRLLLNHPGVGDILPTARGEEQFERVHRNLAGSGLKFVNVSQLLQQGSELDCVFLCTPSGQAMRLVPELLDAGVRIVDLSGDFRFTETDQYKHAYGQGHVSPELLSEAVCGITELHRNEIAGARLVANPGCYVVAATLALAPLLKGGLVELDSVLQISAINGTTGAGNRPRKEILHAESFGSMLPYSLDGHRHAPELEARFAELAEHPVTVSLTTAHGNFARGIYVNAALTPNASWGVDLGRDGLVDIYRDFYGAGHEGDHFVIVNELPRQGGLNVKEYDIYPLMRGVVGSNFCQLGLDFDPERNLIKVVSVIDNLVKGAAGSAIQNMNLMLGFEETSGLRHYGL